MKDDLDVLDEVEGPSEPGAWAPGPGVVQHAGEPLPDDLVFFAPPPPEIGEVVSAASTLRRGKRPMPTLSRLGLAGFVGSAGAAALYFAGVEETILQALAFVVLFPIVWWATSFKHKCSYVGREGLARFVCRGRPDRIVKQEVFLFADAAELRTGQTRHYHNGIYSGTHYHFTWTGPDGKKRFKLGGSYYSEKKPPKPKHEFHFAESAEAAWSAHLFERAKAELQSAGAIRFNIARDHWIAVGPGFLDIHKKGTHERWGRDEIGDIQIGDGTFKIKRVDAKEGWFSSQGVTTFSYAQMGNARLFLLTVQRLLYGTPAS